MIAWSLQHGSETLFWITILISAVGICQERGLEPDNLHPPENRADTLHLPGRVGRRREGGYIVPNCSSGIHLDVNSIGTRTTGFRGERDLLIHFLHFTLVGIS